MGLFSKILGKSDSKENDINLDKLDIPPPPDFSSDDELPPLPPDDLSSGSGKELAAAEIPSEKVPAGNSDVLQSQEASQTTPSAPESAVSQIPPLMDNNALPPLDETDLIPRKDQTEEQQKRDTSAPIMEDVPDPEEEINKRRAEIRSRGEPLFAKVDDYKGIINAADEMKVQIKKCEEILNKLNEVRLEADREHLKWKNELLDIYKKFGYVDKVISELDGG